MFHLSDLYDVLHDPFHDEPELEAADVLKGVAAGVIGGIVGTWVMTQLQPRLQNLAESAIGESDDDDDDEQDQSDPAPAQVGNAMAHAATGHDLGEDEKQQVGQAVHYGFGTLMGAAYGGLAEAAPSIASGFGLPAGVALFLVADEVAVPALGLSGPPTEQPMSTHFYGLASHLVYGVTTDLVRRAVRAVI